MKLVEQEVLDAGFDGLRVFVGGMGHNRKPLGKPHCDCRESNEKFFNYKVTQNKLDPNWSYTMVPVHATSGGECEHCGYMTVLLPPQDHTHALANRAMAKRYVEKNAYKWAVIGTNPETGETKKYASAKEAYEAGNGCVLTAMRKNRPLRGWVWKRANAS